MQILSRLPFVSARLTKHLRDGGGSPLPLRIASVGSSVGNAAACFQPQQVCPLASLSRQLKNALAANGYANDIQTINRCVDGSVMIQQYQKLADLVMPVDPAFPNREGQQIDAVLVVSGMNDGQTGNWNAGQTFTLFQSKLQEIFTLANTYGFDVLIATTPHPVLYQSGWSLPVGYPVNYPPPPNDGVAYPLPADSIVLFDVPGRPGKRVWGSYRHEECNKAMRLAASNRGGVLIDAGAAYFKLVDDFGEAAAYTYPEKVHPNEWAHRMTYGKAIAKVIGA